MNVHKAEAESMLFPPKPSPTEVCDPSVEVARAQVHAILALVEEQRTANLLALLTADNNLFAGQSETRYWETRDEVFDRLDLASELDDN